MKRWKVFSALLVIVIILISVFANYQWDKNAELEQQISVLEKKKETLIQEIMSLESYLKESEESFQADLQEKEEIITILDNKKLELEILNQELEFQKEELGVLNQELEFQKEKLETRVKKIEEEVHSLREKISDTSIGSPQVVDRITFNELLSAIRKYYPQADIKLLDKEYRLISLEAFKGFLDTDNTDSLTRIMVIDADGIMRATEYMDCDDFSLRLKGQAIKAGVQNIGIIVGMRKPFNEENLVSHALNIFVTKENGKIVIYEVEPQNDEMVRIDKPNYQTFYIII